MDCFSAHLGNVPLVQRAKSHTVKYDHTSDPTLGTSFFLLLLTILVSFASLWPKCLPPQKSSSGRKIFILVYGFRGYQAFMAKSMMKFMTTEVWVGAPLLWGTRKKKVWDQYQVPGRTISGQLMWLILARSYPVKIL